MPLVVQAQSASVTIAHSPDVTSVPSGKSFIYTIQYSCSSQTTACQNVVIRDTLSTNLQYESTVGSIHTTSAGYNSTSRVVSFDFGTLNAGSTGEVQVKVKFPQGSTPNGRTALNRAAIFATNASTETTLPSTVTATASALWEVAKTLKTSSFTDFDVSYEVALCSPNAGNVGGLNLTGAQLIDTLPVGTVFVSASNSGVYDPNTRKVSWNLGTISVTSGGCTKRTVTVQYPNSLFNGQTVTNVVEGFGTPIGQAFGALGTAQVSHALTGFVANVSGYVGKYVDYGEKVRGESAVYTFNFKNNGNVDPSNFILTDVIPAAMHVTEIYSGAYTGAAPVSIRIKTNLNPTYTDLAGSPFTAQTTIVPTLGVGESITHIQWDYGTVIVNFGPSSTANRPGLKALVLETDRNGNTVNVGQFVQNCGVLTYTYGGSSYTKTGCVNMEVINPTARPDPYKEETAPSSYLPGSTVGYQLRVRNYGLATHTLDQPILMDLLPTGLTYVDGSWSFNAGNSGLAAPTFEKLDNFAGTGRTLLRWSWSGSVPINADAFVSFNTQVKSTQRYGTLPNTVALTSNQGSVRCAGGKMTDLYDQDGDASTTDPICAYTHNITVQGVPALNAVLSVKGQLDSQYKSYPETGTTMPGGTADYSLSITNQGNVPMTNVVLIDILPAIGDGGVVASGGRGSVWGPNLMGAVAAPSGVTVYYSTSANPCRTELNVSSSGCETANWSTALPPNITAVRSLKFDFGTTVIQPQETLSLSWPMRAPAGAPTTGELAYNSFGYTAKREDLGTTLLAAEPTKVGIQLQPIQGLSVGQFFWMDTNKNGLRDRGEQGINGVRVELYRVGTDGVVGTSDDALEAFTYTANDQNGNPGYYLFPGLSSGSYALRFIPPSGYQFSPQHAGNDEEDSDANASTGYTEVFQLTTTSITNLNAAAFATVADLSLTKTVSNPLAQAGDEVTYTITITNHGPDAVSTVLVHDALPSSLTYLGKTETQGLYDLNTGLWRVGSMASGTSQTLSIRMRVGSECLVYNVAQVNTADAYDPDSTPGNYNGQFNEDDTDVAVINGCASSSSGSVGGMESNGNLAALIATRNFNRSQFGYESEFGRFTGETLSAHGKTDALGSILDAIPQVGPMDTPAIITTPKDLVFVTNATNVFSVDYYNANKRRLSAILALTTPDGSTYEHTKAICDRLGGASLDEVTTVYIGGHPFLMSKLQHPNGEIDYAIWFVAYQKGNTFEVETQFRRAEYHPIKTGAEILNFQVWGVVPQFTKSLVEQILMSLGKQGSLVFNPALPKNPKVFARTARYEAGTVYLQVANLAKASSVRLSGTQAITESGARTAFEQTLVLNPALSIQEVQVPVGSLYDLGFALQNDMDAATDEVYVADGAWGQSFDLAGAKVEHFSVQTNQTEPTSTRFPIARNIEASGTVKTWVAFFRTLQAVGRPKDLSAFNQLTFTAKGTGLVKLVLQKANGEAYSTTFNLEPNGKAYAFSFPMFRKADGGAGFRAHDVTQLIFYVQGNGQVSQAFDVALADLAFVQGAVVANETAEVPKALILGQNYPNPFNPSTSLQFTMPKTGKVRLAIYDTLGRQVAELINGTVSAGVHVVQFNAMDLPSGTYLYRLEANGEAITRRMTLVK